ncbi:SMP-30/gluconolactonase/LRE family protein [Sinirhodobacter huangdaonensis]|uniref:SMP-30/Gluconolactonase/LRE-like region domain-containing protein n=1 Tax=Paenirhodobacter huangdaonensis TaxID=2501515 RepID=A0A443LH07_9RHOB|nr:SMP-30/gluconolactonase/LRE family protein [Sinirhodobacter huangdaonensis]RWR48388.1 hypothetical protein EOW66_18315 [Sinirhodobacter huangdaonensis]
MSLIADIIDRLFHPNRDPHAVPVLDGAFSPNRLLEQAQPVSPVLEGADDFLVLKAEGAPGFLVSVPEGLVRLADGERSLFAATEAAAGAMAPRKEGGLFVALEGRGVLALDAAGRVLWQAAQVAGRPLRAVSALATGPDGRLYAADASQTHSVSDWKTDLMQAGAPSGRIVALDPATGAGEELATGLAWPAGVCVSADGGQLWFSEAWTHRLWSLDLVGGTRRLITRNFTGYPGRIVAQGAGFWISFFALRTELTEFVLSERAFCERMMAEVPRDLWIGPALNSRMAHLAPTQLGGIKKLGIEKAWAPPRSYGLAALFDAQGEGVASWHSRVGGPFHGITALRSTGGRVFALSKGEGVIVELPQTETWLREDAA